MAIELEETEVYGLPSGGAMTPEDGALRQRYGPGNLEVDDFYNASQPQGGGMGAMGGVSPAKNPQEQAMLEMAMGGQGGMSQASQEVEGMSDEELMAKVGEIESDESMGMQPGGTAREYMEEDEYEGSPSGVMAYSGNDEGVGTPDGQNSFMAEKLERNEQPAELARELLARRAAARMNRSQNFQEEAEALNSQDPFSQYLG